MEIAIASVGQGCKTTSANGVHDGAMPICAAIVVVAMHCSGQESQRTSKNSEHGGRKRGTSMWMALHLRRRGLALRDAEELWAGEEQERECV